MSEVPPGWSKTTLGDIAKVIRNGLFKSRPSDQPPGVPILRISAVRPAGLDLSSRKYVRAVSAGELEKFSVRPGDLLLTRYNGTRNLVGIAALVPSHDEQLIYPDKLIRVSLDTDRADARFINYQLASPRVRAFLEPRIRTTAGQSGISGVDIKAVPIALPTISEQRRIVDLLDDHLSRLDAAQASIHVNWRRLERLRLSAASQSLFGEAPWPRTSLANLLEATIGGVWGSPQGEEECDVRVLRVTEMRRDGTLDASTAVIRSVPERQLASRRLRAGDLLLEKSGGGPNTPVGRVGLVPELPDASTCSNFMQLMRPRRDLVDPRFLHLYLQTFYLRGETEPMQKASTNIRNIKASEYIRTEVPVPDMTTQLRLIQSVETVAASCARLDEATADAARRGSVLRRALLDAAFSGRLTGRSTDADVVEQLAEVAS